MILIDEVAAFKDEAIKDGIEGAEKVANNYMSSDNTGIMVADLSDGIETPSQATGENVRITNQEVQIRGGQTIEAKFGSTSRVGRTTDFNIETGSSRINFKDADDVLAYLTGASPYAGFHIVDQDSGQDSAYFLERYLRLLDGVQGARVDIMTPTDDGDSIFYAENDNGDVLVDITYDEPNNKPVLSWNGNPPFTTFTATGSVTLSGNTGGTVTCSGTVPNGYTPIAVQSVDLNNELVTSLNRFVLTANGASVSVRNLSTTQRAISVTVTILCTAF